MKNNKLKLFLENFMFYGGLSMLQKALPFITLPIITRLLVNPSAYGIADMFNLIISFGSALAILGIYDAIFREFFEEKNNKEYQKKVTSTGMNIVLISGLIIMILVLIFRIFIGKKVLGNEIYSNLVVLSGVGIYLSAISSIVSVPTRLRNQRRVYLISGLTFPIIGFGITIISIKLGYTYEALIYGTIGMSIISVISFYFINKNDFSLKIFDKKVAKELLKIGLPLVPTFLIYWIFNSTDRIMINRMLGASELGIYTVGSKVSSISQLIYSAFAGGWSYFAFSTMKDEKQVEINSKIFEYLGVISITVYILAQPFISPVFNLFLKGDYVRGKEVFSFLFLSPLILMLYQTVGNQVIVIKKSFLTTLALLFGAVLNIILNLLFIESYGIRGAAFSTLNSYIVSVIIMCLICYKYKLFTLSRRFLIVSTLTLIGVYSDFFFKEYIVYKLIYGIILIIIFIFYQKDLKYLLKSR